MHGKMNSWCSNFHDSDLNHHKTALFSGPFFIAIYMYIYIYSKYIAMLNNQRRKSVAEIAVLATQGIQSLSGGIDLPSPEPTDVDLRNQTLNDVAKATMVGVFKTASSHSKQHCWYLLILLIGYYMLYILLYDVMIILAVSMGIGIFSSQTVLWHGIGIFHGSIVGPDNGWRILILWLFWVLSNTPYDSGRNVFSFFFSIHLFNDLMHIDHTCRHISSYIIIYPYLKIDICIMLYIYILFYM